MKLKVCGVQSAAEAQALCNIGVDYVGLNFVPMSKRRIDVATGQAIAGALKDSQIRLVALFQNQSLDEVQGVAQAIQPDYVQLHGQEETDYVSALGIPVIKTVSSRQVQTDALPEAAYYLLDRDVQGEGLLVNSEVVSKLADAYPGKVFLAGGLTPDNVLNSVVPGLFAVDVAGGVRSYSRLDIQKVKQLLERLGRLR